MASGIYTYLGVSSLLDDNGALSFFAAVSYSIAVSVGIFGFWSYLMRFMPHVRTAGARRWLYLAMALGSGAQAGFTYQSKKGDYHASLKGLLEPLKDEAKLDELWSIPVGAWFEQGREDPKVTLLRFTPREAAIWASEGNPVLVGLRMINAAMRDDVSEPDVGVHHVIEFDKVA